MLQHQVYVWRMPKEAYKPECLVPTVKHGGGSMTIWAAISWYSADPRITLNSQITASDYVDIVGNQVHLMVQMMFLTMMQFFKISFIHTARSVQSWFEEHEDAFQHLPWPAQLPDLNIVKPLWSVLESRLRIRFFPPTPLKQLDDVLHEEW